VNLQRLVHWLTVAMLLIAAAALAVVVLRTPPEHVLGHQIRILYVHVGAAWTAYLAYVVTALGAVLYLKNRLARWDRLAVASAELGVVLTTLTLMSGSLWARATQGWWWVWEPRLTITLFMWFLYAGYLILRHYTEGEQRARLSAVLALAGIPAMALNHFAVVFFRTFHPQPIFANPEGPAIEGSMFVLGTVLSLTTYTLLYALLVADRMRLETQRERLAALQAAAGR